MLTDEQIQMYELQLKNASINLDEQKIRNMQMESDQNMMDTSMIKEQFDLSQEKQELYYQLRGYTLQQQNGELVWVQDPTNDLSFLTEAGINYCFWMLVGYLNKNILLGNYEEDNIMTKMEDIGVTISDTLFNKSNKYFKEPTLEECKDEIKKRIEKKIELKKFARELLHKEIDEEEIEKEILSEAERNIEEELSKIRLKILNERHRMLNSLVLWMVDQIHGAYQRAWKGLERRSLREHMHISESKGGMINAAKPESFLDRFRRNK